MSSPPSSSIPATITTQSYITTEDDGSDPFATLFILFIFCTLFIRLCLICISTYYRDHGLNPTTLTNVDEDDNLSTGLPINIIKSYHTFHYSKSIIAIRNREHDMTCSICISDYKESETLRMMPKCCHYFHRDCLDTWLKVKGSCPICRYSPMELPV
ncbi:hypothetical protein RIF29_38087 [Crotalaria pallida]|uniref:RING-type domain-containing protein n=1 Tax=Crotalaria pallida TaxID=3830 RepID=A0AAN9DYZ1_CROPI